MAETTAKSAWKKWTTVDEDDELEIIRRRLEFQNKALAATRKERRKIMLRAIKRMRRSEGKD